MEADNDLDRAVQGCLANLDNRGKPLSDEALAKQEEQMPDYLKAKRDKLRAMILKSRCQPGHIVE